MKNVLISGITGFVDSNLVTYLQNDGYTALGISRNPRHCEPALPVGRKARAAEANCSCSSSLTITSNRLSSCSYEALTPETWNNANAMVHLAGKAHDLKNKNQYA